MYFSVVQEQKMKFATAETRIVTAAEFQRSFLPAPMIGIGPYTLMVVAGCARIVLGPCAHSKIPSAYIDLYLS